MAAFRKVFGPLSFAFALIFFPHVLPNVPASAQELLKTVEEDRSTDEYKEQRKRDRGPEIVQLPRSEWANKRILPLVQLLIENEAAFESVKLDNTQRSMIKLLLAECERKTQGIHDKYAHVMDPDEREELIKDEVRLLRADCNRLVTDQLTDTQLLYLYDYLPDVHGLTKTLTDQPIGKAIGLSDEQRAKMRTAANELGERMLADFETYKQEARRIVLDELTAEQRAQLYEVVNPSFAKTIDEHFMKSNIHTLAAQLDYREGELEPLEKRRTTVRGRVFDGFGNEIKPEPQEINGGENQND